MKTLSTICFLAVACLVLAGAGDASAEPIFLSKQYTRCTTCHYSPTGGGLLTPYGRGLSREEISMLGRSAADAPDADPSRGEEAFLGGILGDALGPLQLGVDLRPSHLDLTFGDAGSIERNFFMNADVLAAYQKDGWTFYGELGRQIEGDDSTIASYEHWVGYQAENGVGFRAGRFLPAYGVRFADHTMFNRTVMDLTQYDQIYGVEVSLATDRSLVQVSAGPGRADSIIDDDGHGAVNVSGRVQLDVTPRTAVVASGMFQGTSDQEARSSAGGIALGFAPTARLTTWTSLDARFQELGATDRTYVFVHQTSVEAYRGLWLRISPQIRWTAGDPRGEVRRLVLGADFLPRTHWHVNLSYYRDRNQFAGFLTQTFLAQLHLYL